MQRFDSARRLLSFCLLGALLLSCGDPPDPQPEPGPPDLPRWSTAPHVIWSGPSVPSAYPLAVFVDAPGGPLDQIAADAQVTTFLNDRFQPFFLVPEVVPGLHDPPQALFLDRIGCVRDGPFRPKDAPEWIAHGNAVLLALAAGERSLRSLPELSFSFALAPDHPLRGRCQKPSAAPQ